MPRICPEILNRIVLGTTTKTFKMKTRVKLLEKGQDGLKHLFGMGAYLKRATIERTLLELVNFRVSQINGCAYCLDMHFKDAIELGLPGQKLYLLSAWREVNIYTERERAALSWAEAVNQHQVPQELFDEVRMHFSDEELIDLTLAVAAVGTWNKLNLAFAPLEAGTYQPGQFA